jgi:alpha-tubulin suppressor-like RCC1 family protein
MSFFQNVFAQEYQGYLNTGNDRQYSLTFKIAANQNTQDFTYSWNHDPFDFSVYNTIKINYAWDEEFRNWSSLEINISGLNSNEVTAYEVVSSLNADATFASMFEARVSKNGIKNHVLIVANKNRPKRIVKMYISNTSAERILRFNKKAPVGEIMSFFSRDTIDNRFTFPLSLAHLIELDPENEFDAQIISEAGFDPDSPKADWELLRGRASGIYTFKKQTVDEEGRIVEIIEYPAGALVGDLARKTIYTFTDTNTEPDEIFQIPHVLTSDDLITPPTPPVAPIVGTVWGVGNNGNGELGDNTTDDRSSPVQTICGGSNWVQINCGYYNIAGLKDDGTLWTWGQNEDGGLGDNTTDDKSSPVQTICGGNDWKTMVVGTYFEHCAAIKTDGTLWLWGHNSDGEIGDETTDDKSSPVQTICGGTDWKQVASGGSHTAAIKDNGTLWCWGQNSNGQLGDNTSVTKSSPVQTICGGIDWKSVSCGKDFIAAIKNDGTCWTWGRNGYGQLGDETTNDRSSPVQTVTYGTDWKQISCGDYHMLAIKNNGTCWTWGNNGDGQLGDETTNDRSSPIQTVTYGTDWKQVEGGQYHSAAIKNDGTCWVWGDNGNGRLGDETTDNRSSPVQTIMADTNWLYVSAGYETTFGIRKA